MTLEEFIEKSNIRHNNKFDYSKVKLPLRFIDRVCIICPIHGEFEQSVEKHLKHGCQKCVTHTLEKFIELSNMKHNGIYDYKYVNYINTKTKVTIVCKKHGKFEQFPTNHYTRGMGCKKCAFEKRKSTLDDFIKRFVKKHGTKYDYRDAKYINSNTKITIICPFHGPFLQRPSEHLKYGCGKCGLESSAKNRTRPPEEFIARANEMHLEKYIYDKVEYVNLNTKVIIICRKHGEFLQSPAKHFRGEGCPICKTSINERQILKILKQMNLEHKPQAKFQDCRYKNPLPFDFWAKTKTGHEFLIEFQGAHHYMPVKRSKSTTDEEAKSIFELVKLKDSIKERWSKDNNIPLLVISYLENGKIKELLTDFINKLDNNNLILMSKPNNSKENPTFALSGNYES